MTKIDNAFDSARNYAKTIAGELTDHKGNKIDQDIILQVSSKDASILVSPCGTKCHSFYNGDNPEAREKWKSIDDLFPKAKKTTIKPPEDPYSVKVSWSNGKTRDTQVGGTPERMEALENYAEEWETFGHSKETQEEFEPELDTLHVNEKAQYEAEKAFFVLLHNWGWFIDIDEEKENHNG